MEEGDAHRLPRRLDRAAVTNGRLEKVHDRLSNAEEHQADAHAGREQHGKPGGAAVVGGAVVRPEFDVAIAADAEEHHGAEDDCHGQDVEPADVADDPALDVRKQALRMGLEHARVEHDQQQQDRRNPEYRGIDSSFWCFVRRCRHQAVGSSVAHRAHFFSGQA